MVGQLNQQTLAEPVANHFPIAPFNLIAPHMPPVDNDLSSRPPNRPNGSLAA
jgi:hypothetical protein